MAIAQGINKIVVIKKQSALGTPASGSGGQALRRETASFNLDKNTYTNNEIATHQQSTGETHGLRSSSGTLAGVLSPGTYKQVFESFLRRDFTTGASASGVSVTIAGSGPTYTVTRSAGSYLTDGFKIGDVIRLTVGSLNAANINKNLVIANLTATVATVYVLNGVAMVAQGPVTGTTITVFGKKTYAPSTGHTIDYWTAEEWHSDISVSNLITDAAFKTINVGLPSDGNATFSTELVGLDATGGTSQVLTTPTSESTTAVTAAINGILIIDNAKVALVTAANIVLENNAANVGGVVGSNVSPDIQRGRIQVSGSLSVFLQDNDLYDLYNNATNAQLVIVIAADNTASSNFISFTIPKLKFSSAARDDGEKAIVQTMSFTAERNGAGGSGIATEQTIASIQDSAA